MSRTYEPPFHEARQGNRITWFGIQYFVQLQHSITGEAPQVQSVHHPIGGIEHPPLACFCKTKLRSRLARSCIPSYLQESEFLHSFPPSTCMSHQISVRCAWVVVCVCVCVHRAETGQAKVSKHTVHTHAQTCAHTPTHAHTHTHTHTHSPCGMQAACKDLPGQIMVKS
jgi:hypothetical protein